MRNIIVCGVCSILCLSVINVSAAEKGKALIHIDAARVAIEAATPKVGDNKAATADLELARASLKKAEDAYEKGKPMFGMGDIKPELEQIIKHFTGLTELAVSLADTHLAKARAEAELEPIEKQLTVAKAKVKLFEDRKAEIEQLKVEAAKYQAVAKELETLKADKEKITARLDALITDKSDLAKKNEALTSEIARLSALRDTPETPKAKPAVKNDAAPVATPGVVPPPAPALTPPKAKQTPAAIPIPPAETKTEQVPIVPPNAAPTGIPAEAKLQTPVKEQPAPTTATSDAPAVESKKTTP